MKNLFSILLLCLISLQAYAQAPDRTWATRAGGTGLEVGKGIAANGSGNSYVTGSFSGDCISFGNTTLTNTGGPFPYEVFVAKLDASPNSIEEITASGACQAYPNPVKDILYLRNNNNKSLPGLLQVYEYTGRKVLAQIADGKQAAIDMQLYRRGCIG